MPARVCAPALLAALAAASSDVALPAWVPRPIYFGLRETKPDGLLFGFAWTNAFAPDRGDLRHGIYAHHRVKESSWYRHDVHGFGQQFISDPLNGVNLTTEYYAHEDASGWCARVRGDGNGSKVTPSGALEPAYLSVYLYVSSPTGRLSASVHGSHGYIRSSDEGNASAAPWVMAVAPDGPLRQPQHAVTWASAAAYDAANKNTGFRVGSSGKRALHSATVKGEWDEPHWMSLSAPPEDVWRIDDALHGAAWSSWSAAHDALRERMPHPQPLPPIVPLLRDKNPNPGEANVVVMQYVLAPPFQLRACFKSGRETADVLDESPAMDAVLTARANAFDARLCARLHLCEGSTPPGWLRLARAALGNLLGSMTYFAGSQLVATPTWYESMPPAQLFTGVPSRSYFPRGFLWDEGFHQMLVSIMYPDSARAALGSWLSLMDETGWIAREVILGLEARDRVHSDFWVQFRDIANPPTLILAMWTACARVLAAKANSSAHLPQALPDCGALSHGMPIVPPLLAANEEHSLILCFANATYDRMRTHVMWFERTQAASRPGALRWRGSRTGGDKLIWHHFASGMDDFPRGVSVTDNDEAVDAYTWMTSSYLTLAELANALGRHADAAHFHAMHTQHADELIHGSVYWDDTRGVYCDIAPVRMDANASGHAAVPVLGRACHIGYLGIFPLLLRVLPVTSPRLPRLLDVMEAPEHMWSPFGLRGLSRSDPLYGVEETFTEDYWRSSVWINMNYLAIGALHHYAAAARAMQQQQHADMGALGERCMRLATQLREGVINNMLRVYEETGYVWEHFDSHDGHGRGTHPFTGWSALIVAIMANEYVP